MGHYEPQWTELTSRARQPERAGSARLSSLEAREPLRAEPSRSELELAREPRAIFPALHTTPSRFDTVAHH